LTKRSLVAPKNQMPAEIFRFRIAPPGLWH
jgi:hypothetical protein